VTALAWRSARWLPLWLGLAAACGAPARPPAMARMGEVHAAPATTEAEAWAPQAHAHALELEAQAEAALRDGDSDAAALIAERAIAAHEHAWALTRLARAERRRLDAEKELADQRRALGELRAQHQRLAAEAAALELRAQVARSALPVPPHETSPVERREARRRAAAALSAQARLLCVGARLLGAEPRVAPVLARLDELDQKLTSGAESRAIETATELRSECLAIISEIRHQNSAPAARLQRQAPSSGEASNGASTAPASPPAPVSAAPLPADALLEELSAAGAAPSRDDRGISVSLRDLFGADGKLLARARPEIERLVRVAVAHRDFPVLLVAHSSSDRGAAEVERQLELLRAALANSGVAKLAVTSVGDRQPLLPQRSPSARARNQRIELVFVAPGF
jgi:outer membrane protein OmpA-like peptidoglycan-associated protein